MRLYRWSSKALQRYGNGIVGAVAGTEDEARGLILADFRAFYREEKFWMDPLDPDDIEDYERMLSRLREDIAVPAQDTLTIFVMGSE
jgi:hypothetical protein